jgi:parallel beta-helix repeat protein
MMWGVKINRFIALAVAFLIFTLNSSTGIAVEIFVQPGESIQAAINNASSGDEIVIGSGNYKENIMITKDDLVIRSETGNPEDTIIEAGNSGGNVLYMQANNVTIRGIKIRAAEYPEMTGIHMTTCSNCAISNNDLSENYLGLSLSNSKNNMVSNNSMNLNENYGIHLIHSENNVISNNTANSNTHGIVLESNSDDNNLKNNLANSNFDYGFYIISSGNNTVNNNTAIGNEMGIYAVNSNRSIISGNNVSENVKYGIWLSRSNYGTICWNIAKKMSYGIHLDSSDNNRLYGNIIASNIYSGLSMCRACDNNTVFNNYFNNVYNTNIGNNRNHWNIKRTKGKNIVGGPYIAGNFWTKPGGNGFSETAPDENKDGIADVVYNETNVTDYLPLVSVPDPEQELILLETPITVSNSSISTSELMVSNNIY